MSRRNNELRVILETIRLNNTTIEYFGENYSNIIYLLYDGIHYDVLVQEGK